MMEQKPQNMRFNITNYKNKHLDHIAGNQLMLWFFLQKFHITLAKVVLQAKNFLWKRRKFFVDISIMKFAQQKLEAKNLVIFG